MAREFLHAVDDILEAIAGIDDAVRGKSLADYRQQWLLRHAIQRAIEIISEASRAIPDEVKATQSDIPWPSIHAIGNVLRHEYQGLSDQIIWNVGVDELPKLKEALTQIRNNFDTARRPE